MPGVSVSNVVSVELFLSPTAAQYRNFGIGLLIGSSPVIDTGERIRTYTTLGGVAADFPASSPEYQAAQNFFSAIPTPYVLKIGRWAQSATSASLKGAIIPPSQQGAVLAALSAVTNGQFVITIDGQPRTLSGLNLSAAVTLNGVAGVLNAAISNYASVVWNGQRFVITSNSTGVQSTLGYGATTAGTDIATPLGFTLASGASVPVAGIVSESAVDALLALANATSAWYAAFWAPLVPMSTTAALQVAAAVQGLSPARCVGFTDMESTALDPTSNTDLASQLSAAGYRRSLVQYSSTNAYAIAAFFGRALSVNFEAPNSTITMKFKQEPGIIPEALSESQRSALIAKNCNMFVDYDNGTAIVEPGVTCSGDWWDEVQGLDWLLNAIQTDVFNAFYTSATKIPQTDDGTHTLMTVVEATLDRAVTNGLVAAGVWNQDGFGQLKRGDFMAKGFYSYAPSVNQQSQADRDARKAPPITLALKLAGAYHSADVQLYVNR